MDGGARCVRYGCGGRALAPWWQLCATCTEPLLDPVPAVDPVDADPRWDAGWDAVTWAERIAPSRWGQAVVGDAWVTELRCRVLAAGVTGRADGCAHSADATVTAPVVAIPRAPVVLRCPPCAEPVVGTVTTDGHACDRCHAVPVTTGQRVAAIAGAALIVVAQLCDECRRTVLELAGSR